MATGRRDDAHRLLDRVARICAAAQDPLTLLERVAHAVRPLVPYEAAGWLLVDPDTLLMTGVYAEGVPREVHLALIESELLHPDVNPFAELAAAEVPAASLAASTDGRLERSHRWRTVYEPLRYGDELRTVFRSGHVTWGQACLTRGAGQPHFSPAEVDLLARTSPHVGNGLRACLLVDGPRTVDEPAAPAMVVLHDDGSVESMTPAAERWLGDLDDERLTTTVVVHEVAQRARRLAEAADPADDPGDTDDSGAPAMARARLPSGEWLVVRGARLEAAGGGRARTAVVLEPARRADLAPMVVRLHQLTPREQQVTQLLLQGLTTDEMARSLLITSETLRGHVKSVYAKLGVTSRPELAATLSPEPSVRIADVPGPRAPR